MNTSDNNKLLIWGSLFCLGMMILCGGAMLTAWNLDKEAARYPGSREVAEHTNYALPKLYRWDHTYATNATINDVYQWYSITFDLGPESQANGGCSLLEDLKSYLFYSRYTGVLICETGDERLMFVTRSTTFFP